MTESTSNNFARLLIFYDTIKRAKLNEKDLTKIVQKYAQKSNDMIADLKLKYSELYNFPPEVLLIDLQRVLHCYPIPECVRSLLPLPLPLAAYDPLIDIRSTKFDAATVLACRSILATAPMLPHAPPVSIFDNMSKARRLLPGGPAATPTSAPPAPSLSTKKTDVKHVDQKQRKSADQRPLERIALASSSERAKTTSTDQSSSAISPLILLYNAMSQRRRVRVLIRRVNR